MRLNFIIDYLYKKAFALTRDKIVKEMERKQIDRNYLSDFLEVHKCSKQHTTDSTHFGGYYKFLCFCELWKPKQ